MHPYLAEFVGTALLLLLGCGTVANVILNKTKGNNGGLIAIAFGWGLAVFAAVAFAGPYSGAHLNPAVSFGLAIAGKFAWAEVPGFVLAQLAGAFAGAVLVWMAYRDHFKATEDGDTKLAVFATGPAIRNYFNNVVTEVIGTFVLILVVLYFTSPEISGDILEGTEIGLGSIGALPVGLLVVVIGIALGGPTGYAINPARDLGPRIAHALLPIPQKGTNDWPYAWVPVVGPLIGAALAAGLYLLMGV